MANTPTNIPQRDPRRFVYFITDGTAIKIGWASSVEHRLADLQVGHSAALRIVATFPGDRTEEGALHRHFAHLNIRGEWFTPCQEITDFIAELESLRPHLKAQRINIHDIVHGRHRQIIDRHNFPGECKRLMHFIDRTIDQMLPEHRPIAKRARWAAYGAQTKVFWLSDRLIAMTMADLDAFAKINAVVSHPAPIRASKGD